MLLTCCAEFDLYVEISSDLPILCLLWDLFLPGLFFLLTCICWTGCWANTRGSVMLPIPRAWILVHSLLVYSPLPPARQEGGGGWSDLHFTVPDPASHYRTKQSSQENGRRKSIGPQSCHSWKETEIFSLFVKRDLLDWPKENHLLNFCLSPPAAIVYGGTDFP